MSRRRNLRTNHKCNRFSEVQYSDRTGKLNKSLLFNGTVCINHAQLTDKNIVMAQLWLDHLSDQMAPL